MQQRLMARMTRIRTVAGLLAALSSALGHAQVGWNPAQEANHIWVQDSAALAEYERRVRADPTEVVSGTSLGCSPSRSLLMLPAGEATRTEVTQMAQDAAVVAIEILADAGPRVIANVAGPYERDWNGPWRDTLSTYIGVLRGASFTVLQLRRPDFQFTAQGVYALCFSVVGAHLLVEPLGFFTQEILKAHLINKLQMDRNRAAWAAWGMSVALRSGLNFIAAYSISSALSPSFKKEGDQRKLLMEATNLEFELFRYYDDRLHYYHTPAGMAEVGSANWHAVIEYLSDIKDFHRSNYFRSLSEFTSHDDTPFGDRGAQTVVDPEPRRVLNSYPATNYAAAPNMELMLNALYAGFLRKCTSAAHGSLVRINCPHLQQGSAHRIEVRFDYLKRNRQGKIDATLSRRTGSGRLLYSRQLILDPLDKKF